MSEAFDASGKIIGITAISAGPIFVTQVRTKDKDGYEAVQVGFGLKKKNSKPKVGHLKKVNIEGIDSTKLNALREFRIENPEMNLGDKIDVSIFKPGEKVTVQSVSKSKGFQGVVKRHGFHGGPKTHGNKHQNRAPGSIGATTPQHVIKGRKMAGRMGGDTITTKNLKVFSIEPEHNMLLLEGAVPGKRGSLIKVMAK